MSTSFKRGISVVEIIVSAAIIAVSVTGIVAAIQVYLKVVYQNTRETQAVLILDETAEALQYMRDESFSDFYGDVTFGDSYTVFWNGTGYELSTSTISLPYNMTRTVVFDQITRAGDDQISTSGTTDPRTLKATLSIEWPYKEANEVITAEILIHDLYEN